MPEPSQPGGPDHTALLEVLAWAQTKIHISIAQCKTVVSPVRTHWRYHSLAQRHWYVGCMSRLFPAQATYFTWHDKANMVMKIQANTYHSTIIFEFTCLILPLLAYVKGIKRNAQIMSFRLWYKLYMWVNNCDLLFNSRYTGHGLVIICFDILTHVFLIHALDIIPVITKDHNMFNGDFDY